MLAALVADVTDTPVWVLAGATILLFIVTGLLAGAAIAALRQLGVALEQLEEVKRDRHVQVFIELGSRWESRQMAEALHSEKEYKAEDLLRLIMRAGQKRSRNPIRERRRISAAKKTIVLLRVPNYFEDAAMIAQVGGLVELPLFVENFGGVAVDEWKRWHLAVKLLQETDPLAYVEFERLAKRAEAEDPGSPPAD